MTYNVTIVSYSEMKRISRVSTSSVQMKYYMYTTMNLFYALFYDGFPSHIYGRKHAEVDFVFAEILQGVSVASKYETAH